MTKNLSTANPENWPKIRPYFWSDQIASAFINTLFDWSVFKKKSELGTKKVYLDLLLGSCWQMIINEETNRIDSPKRPMYYQWLKLHKANFKPLLAAGLIECDKYSFGDIAKCRNYWIPIAIIQQVQSLLIEATKHDTNLYTGSRWMRNDTSNKPVQVERFSLQDENDHPKYPKLIMDAVAILEEQQLKQNTLNLRNYHKRASAIYNRLDKRRDFELGMHLKLQKSLLGIINETACLILRASDDIPNDNVFNYCKQSYKVNVTGRISEVGGGLQGARRKIKGLMIEGTGYRNFDLKSSQLYGLHYYTQDAELLACIGSLYDNANNIGFSKDIMKGAVFGLLFNCGRPENKGCDKLEKYAKENGLDFIAAMKLLQPIINAAESFASVLIDLGRWQNLADCKMTQKELDDIVAREWDAFVREHEDAPTWGDDFKDKWTVSTSKKKLLAFYLQGLEAYIIHTMTVEYKRYNYVPKSNQHDGIVIEGDPAGLFIVLKQINDTLGYHFIFNEKPIDD